MTPPVDQDLADATDALELAHLDVVLPPPHRLRQALAEGLLRSYVAFTEGRTVTRPEDTYEVQRRLARAQEVFTDYSRAYAYAATLVRQYQREELTAAVGENGYDSDDGDPIPARSLTVPDRAGDLRVIVQYENVRDFDLDQLIKAAAAAAAWKSWDEGDGQASLGERQEMAERGIREFLELGKFEPQARKVDAYAGSLARNGHDSQAAVVASAVTPSRRFVGVKHERKERKP
jgi:hypothetical protein